MCTVKRSSFQGVGIDICIKVLISGVESGWKEDK